MVTKSRPMSTQSLMTVPESLVDTGVDTVLDVSTPLSPTQTSGTVETASKRHAKGLSLNFPILLPFNAQVSASPTAGSSILQSPVDSARSSPRPRPTPLTSPSLHENEREVNQIGSTDFLTLLAAQERRVLELKEELQRAETDLLGLKKKWAAHEANKKRNEVKHVKQLQPLARNDVGTREPSEDEVDEERRRKRAIVERSHLALVSPSYGSTPSTGLTRKGSKRVFEGGRHTRTLSLLSPTSSKPNQASTETSVDELTGYDNDTAAINTDPNVIQPPLSLIPTLDSLIAGEPLQLGFGKTYKDLAAHRRSVPSADVFVKQGKQVYDGVRDGLWTFLEDIRQATVGEEGISGTVAQQRPVRAPQRRATKESMNHSGHTTTESRKTPPKESSFWREFGLDSPQRPGSKSTVKADKSSRHIQQKSSTDSSNPPSLLPDSNDHEDGMDDSWDAWDSPASVRDKADVLDGKRGNGLPWPEIEKITPSKLTKTVSDLMREWDTSPDDADTVTDGSDSRLRGARATILDHPHI
ncbi:hypothetical protein PV08_08673 [Exophiala spinifera]|uniref:DUF4048 domain-containing protein n=1 Tax=Exophiala spinifera TaxID=91928 RepID=A0A0D2B480_9EURO|nr:uncharacterized protein PV08_08673 [Exophiala spinifera]KIW13485.1 hypothetical protein PV08_08673 [Exophiala spinifera]